MENTKKKAFQLLVIFGVISLLGDIVYEGARSVNGPYLKTLAANAAMVGLITGLGEFFGYALRLLSGYYSDKTKAHWFFTFAGYGLIISVPLLSLTGVWQIAAVLMVTERIGKALRAPSKDAIMSSAAKQVGTGFGFGLHEAMDQIGALAGPAIFAIYFAVTGAAEKTAADYQNAYSLFWIPFIIMMACLIYAFTRVPDPSGLEEKKANEPDKLTKLFWTYTIFAFVTAAGFISFAIMGYHFKAQNILSDFMIPVYYGIAMAVDGVAALAIGISYDKFKEKSGKYGGGLLTLIIMPLLSILIPFFAFTKNAWLALLSAVLWGVVMGAHETIMRSAIADITPVKKRGTGYGIFSFTYGLAMLLGGWLAGVLYEVSITTLCFTFAGIQVIALIIFAMLKTEINKHI